MLFNRPLFQAVTKVSVNMHIGHSISWPRSLDIGLHPSCRYPRAPKSSPSLDPNLQHHTWGIDSHSQHCRLQTGYRILDSTTLIHCRIHREHWRDWIKDQRWPNWGSHHPSWRGIKDGCKDWGMEGLGASWGVYSQGPMGLPYQGLKYQKPTVNLLFTTRHTTQTEDALLFTQQKSDTRHFCDYFVYIIKEKKKIQKLHYKLS